VEDVWLFLVKNQLLALFIFYPTYKFFPELPHDVRNVPMTYALADSVVDNGEPGA